MRLYLDDDSASPLLARLLIQAGHVVVMPIEVDLAGAGDPLHLAHAIRDGRVLITGNHDDFQDLHGLLMEGRGHHPGIFVIRRDNDPRRDLTHRGIVVAIANVVSAGIPLADQFVILNHWR